MSQVNTARLGAGFAKTLNTSLEENDVNININAETEGGEQETPEVVETAPEVDVDAVPLDTSETPEASELEVQEVQAEGDAVANDVEELDNSLDSLESIYYALNNVSAEGMEITPAFARMTHVAVDNAVSRFGLTAADCGVASVEAIELAPNAEIETSMENVLTTIKEGDKQTSGLMSRLWATFVEFLKSIFTATGRSEKKLAELQKRVSSFSGVFRQVTVPANLGGATSGADLKAYASVAKAFTSAKYADIAVLAKSDNITEEQIAGSFEKANSAVLKYGEKATLPGYRFTKKPGSGPTLESLPSKTAEVTFSKSDASGYLDGAKAMLSVAIDYKGQQGIRKQVTDAFKVAAGGAAKEESKMLDAMRARRKLSTAWSRTLNTEQRVVGIMITATNSACNVVASAMAGKGSKGSKENVVATT